MRRCFSVMLMLALATGTRAQTMVFDMILFGDSAGRETVTRTHTQDGDVYTLDSYIRGKILWINRTNHTHYEALYKDGKLYSSTYYEINNDKKDKWDNIQWDGHQYTVDSQHGKKTLSEAVVCSIGPFYCGGYTNAPRRFFNESDADFNELKYPEANVIEFKSSDGYRNVFRFNNGQLTNIEFHTTFATVYLKRVK